MCGIPRRPRDELPPLAPSSSVMRALDALDSPQSGVQQTCATRPWAAKVEQWSELTAKVISTVPPTCRIGKPLAQGDKASHRSTVKWALARGPWGMAVAAEKINAWFDFAARECFEERHWEVAARLPEATLSHRSGALGALLCGHLIRFDMTNIVVERAPENPCNLLVRPEVRGQYDQGNSLKFWHCCVSATWELIITFVALCFSDSLSFDSPQATYLSMANEYQQYQTISNHSNVIVTYYVPMYLYYSILAYYMHASDISLSL